MATRFESIHLPHFMAADADAPANVRRLAAHYGDLVRFASQAEPGQSRKTPLPCRHRPGRKVCGGLLVVESVLPEPCDVPRCTGGRRRCPPEDCGGPWGYAEFLDAIADPANQRHDELCEWHGGDFDPAEFDVDDVNAALRRGAVE